MIGVRRALCAAVMVFGPALLAISAAGQSTIHVPADQPTIQAAIQAAQNGDVVAVASGTYVENIDFAGKAITVKAENGPSSTTIDGNGSGAVVTFQTGEGPASILQGFTITNGLSAPDHTGGGIYVYASSPTIRDNIVQANSGCSGAGIGVLGGSPVIRGNTISKNKMSFAGGCSGADGGGLFVHGPGSPIIDKNVITFNIANIGGGVALLSGATPLATQNVIAYNAASQGGGIYYQGSGTGTTLVNNTIAGNDSVQGAGLWVDPLDALLMVNNVILAAGNEAAVYCANSAPGVLSSFVSNDVFSAAGASFLGACADQTGFNHNISSDPLLSNAPQNDFHLSLNSPAMDAGDNGAVATFSSDLDGNPRIVDGTGSGTATADMGALEFQGTTTMSVSPVSLSFADTTLGDKVGPQTITVTNTGTRTLYVKALQMPADFTEGNNCGSATGVAPGAGCLIDVTFAPATSGSHSETLTVQAGNVAGSGTDVTLMGKGLSPLPSFNPTSLTFPDQLIFTTSASKTVTVTNIGDSDLVVSNVNATVDYVVTHDCTTVVPGAHCTLTIAFDPVFVGPRPGRVTMFLAKLPTPYQVNLSGNGIGPGISLSASSLSFASMPANRTSAAQTVVVTSSGTSALTINTIAATGDFAQTNDCPHSLAVNATCTVSVLFKPAQSGTSTGTLSINSDASQHTSDVVLFGTATAPLTISLSAASLSFPAQLLGKTSDAQTVVVTNNNDTLLAMPSITVTGDFAETNNCGSALAAHTSCNVSVTFSPTTSGQITGSLIIDDGENAPVTLLVTGYGASIPIAVLSTTSVTFPSQLAGTASPVQTVGIVNGGVQPLIISSVTIAGSFQQTNTCGTAIAPGDHCGVAVVFAPTAGGDASGTITIAHNAAGSPTVVSLSGHATDFLLGPSGAGATSATVTAGSPASYALSMTAAGGFSGTVALTCSGGPSHSSCAVNPTSLTLSGSNPVDFTATVQTVAPSAGSQSGAPFSGHGGDGLAWWLVAAAALAVTQRRLRQRPAYAALCVLTFSVALLTSCGGGGTTTVSHGTPAGTYTVVVSGTSGSLTRTINLTLTVK